MIHCPFCDPVGMSVELIFSAVVIILCALIYVKTKELYELTKHKGISYFRNTFLFFGLAFLFRLAFHLLVISGIFFDFRFPREVVGPLPLLVTSYFSTIAILYLLLSLLWRKVNPEQFLLVSHIAAFSVAIITYIFHSPQVLVLVQLFLIVFTLLLAYFRSRHSKSFSKLFVLYILLFVGWLANMFVLSPRWRIPFEANAVSYAVSIAAFALIFYKVYRWTK